MVCVSGEAAVRQRSTTAVDRARRRLDAIRDSTWHCRRKRRRRARASRATGGERADVREPPRPATMTTTTATTTPVATHAVDRLIRSCCRQSSSRLDRRPSSAPRTAHTHHVDENGAPPPALARSSLEVNVGFLPLSLSSRVLRGSFSV